MRGPERESLEIVILGLSITSAWGNGHATTYRGLVRELALAGHSVSFLERDVPWYAMNRDAPSPEGARVLLYRDLEELKERSAHLIRDADVVIVGSYVPSGVEVARFVLETARGLTAFYDIDTPVTLAKLGRGDYEYLHPALIPSFDLYLSFTGGPTLDYIETHYGARAARHLACSADPSRYKPTGAAPIYELGYLGTFSADRQPALEGLLFETARRRPRHRFVVGGPSYPAELDFPPNVEWVEHVPPLRHASFYGSQRATLNITRADMVRAGFSPSVRLFEAAACGLPIISDRWSGIETYFEPGAEILLADSASDVLRYLFDLSLEALSEVGQRARARVLREHTARARAAELLRYIAELRGSSLAAE
jgi:spore maturation protein CgeB